MKPELYVQNPQLETQLQKYIAMSNKSGRSSENTVSTVGISPQRDRYSTAPNALSPGLLESPDKIDSASARSRLSKQSSASSRLESGMSPNENIYQYESRKQSKDHTSDNSLASRRHSKDIVGELFIEKKQIRRVILCGEMVLHDRMANLYPMLHSDVVDVVIDYEKQVFGKDSLDPDELPVLEKRCKRKLDELTARKAKIMFTNDERSTLNSRP